MNERIDVQSAIRHSILTEKNAMDFYRLAARQMRDPRIGEVFTRLAGEERTHAWWFYRIYRGGDLPEFDALMDASPAMDTDWLSDLEKILKPDLKEIEALKLALEKEERLEQKLRETAESVEDPEVRQVYLANAEATHRHHLVIAEEYVRMAVSASGSTP